MFQRGLHRNFSTENRRKRAYFILTKSVSTPKFSVLLNFKAQSLWICQRGQKRDSQIFNIFLSHCNSRKKGGNFFWKSFAIVTVKTDSSADSVVIAVKAVWSQILFSKTFWTFQLFNFSGITSFFRKKTNFLKKNKVCRVKLGTSLESPDA